MSEPDDSLEDWCRRLVEAYVMQEATQPRWITGSKGPTSKKAKLGREREADSAGYASGTETEVAERDESAPRNELLQLIDAVQPQTTPQAAEGGEANSTAVVGEPLVPQTLPRAMKTNIYQVTRQQFSELYAVDAALARVERGVVSRCELVSMYMRSFRNVLTYDLFELREHKTYFSRFMGYCTYVLHDLVEALFPEESHTNIVSVCIIRFVNH